MSYMSFFLLCAGTLIFSFMFIVFSLRSVLLRCLVSCDGRRDSSLWSWSISIHQPWWMCCWDWSAVWSHRHFGLKRLLYEINWPTFRICIQKSMKICSSNVIFFPTVAEWREACTEARRAHSPWERWRGKMASQVFLYEWVTHLCD